MNEVDSSMTGLAHVNEVYAEEYKIFLDENKIESSEESAILFLEEKEKEVMSVEQNQKF